MKINRIWAMPSSETFTIKPIKSLIQKHLSEIKLTNPNCIVVDPFVRNSVFKSDCTFTNDLNPNIKATHNLEALEFLKLIDSDSVDLLFFDPPYSARQIKECYNGIGLKVHQSDTQMSFYAKKKDEIARTVKVGGKVISFGWNSGGIGKTRGFQIEEVLMVPHGGSRNDTICVVERKIK